MPLAVGDRVPSVKAWTMGPDGPAPVDTAELLGAGRVVLFGLPGAFTPGCSRQHLPGFVQGAAELSEHGVDRIVCTAVNDAFVMDAWATDQGVGDSITMLADGNGDFAEAMDLLMDGSGFGMGRRSRRYAAVLEDGVVTQLDVEEGRDIGVSSCSAVLSHL